MRYALNTVPINGNQILYGYGTAALALTASGFSSRQKYGVSTAALTVLTASGQMKKAKSGSGTASLSLTAAGTMKQAVPAYGQAAAMTLTARYGIPRPKYIPPGVTNGHPSRELRIPADGRIIDISPEGEF